jgi:radical SAM protein with 4Fe4S-binding SPASM domain
MRNRYFTTSPYLLWNHYAPGKGRIYPLHQRHWLPDLPEVVELLTLFSEGGHTEEMRVDLREIDRTGGLVARAVSGGFLVEDLNSHRQNVFTSFERHFDPRRPKIGYIETTSRCPFTCVMCPKSSASYDRPDAIMSMQLFLQIIKQLKHQRDVTLHLFGDPLMDPNIFERLAELRKNNLRGSFSTNAMMITESFYVPLLTSGIGKLVISCDAVSNETYRAMRGPRAKQYLAEQRLRGFLDAWQARGRPIQVILRFVNLDINISERKAFLDRWSGYAGVQFDIKTHLKFPDVSSSLDTKARLPIRQGFLTQKQGGRAPVKCLRHWFSSKGELGIQVDGAVVPCCLSHTREVILGDLSIQPLDEIWRSDKFARLRRAIFFKDGLEEFSTCARCNFDYNYDG